MKKIIAIFTCLFFNSLFSSSYHECMKRVQGFRMLNHETQIFVREYAAKQVSESLEEDYSDFLKHEKSVLKQKESEALAKKVALQKAKTEKAIKEFKPLIEKLKNAYDQILQKNRSFRDSIVQVEKTEIYKELVTRYPVVEKAEYKNMLDSVFLKHYQAYYLSFMMKNTKEECTRLFKSIAHQKEKQEEEKAYLFEIKEQMRALIFKGIDLVAKLEAQGISKDQATNISFQSDDHKKLMQICKSFNDDNFSANLILEIEKEEMKKARKK